MAPIDLITNLAALLLWLNWRMAGFVAAPVAGVSLAGTLKRTEPERTRRWWWLVFLLLLIVGRALFYCYVGSAVNWVAALRLGATTLFFRSDHLALMHWFSWLSFGLTMAVFYCWLVLLSVANRSYTEGNPEQKLVRLHLGWLEPWPAFVKLLLPLVLIALLWRVLAPALVTLAVIPAPVSTTHLWEQGLVIGLGAFFAGQYLIIGLLLLHLLHSYVYLGDHSFWKFVPATANRLLGPLRRLPLRAGQLDLAPLLGVALVWAAAHFGLQSLTEWFKRLPL